MQWSQTLLNDTTALSWSCSLSLKSRRAFISMNYFRGQLEAVTVVKKNLHQRWTTFAREEVPNMHTFIRNRKINPTYTFVWLYIYVRAFWQQFIMFLWRLKQWRRWQRRQRRRYNGWNGPKWTFCIPHTVCLIWRLPVPATEIERPSETNTQTHRDLIHLYQHLTWTHSDNRIDKAKWSSALIYQKVVENVTLAQYMNVP